MLCLFPRIVVLVVVVPPNLIQRLSYFGVLVSSTPIDLLIPEFFNDKVLRWCFVFLLLIFVCVVTLLLDLMFSFFCFRCNYLVVWFILSGFFILIIGYVSYFDGVSRWVLDVLIVNIRWLKDFSSPRMFLASVPEQPVKGKPFRRIDH